MKRCTFNEQGKWRRCSKNACVILQHKLVTLWDYGPTERTVHMHWYECSLCKAWASFGGSNDGSDQSIELRAAELAQEVIERLARRGVWGAHAKSSILHKIANGGEIAGWITYVIGSWAPTHYVEEMAGYLAAAIYAHDIDHAVASSEAA